MLSTNITSIYNPYLIQPHSQNTIALAAAARAPQALHTLPTRVEALQNLVRVTEDFHPRTIGHSQRVAEVAVTIGEIMGLPLTDLTALRSGGVLHDLGKIYVPDTILRKTSALTFEEQIIMRQHPARGWEILHTIGHFENLQPMVLWHHERYDGSGYPDQLLGDEIPLTARIMAVADSFDAMKAGRSYRAAAGVPQIIEIFREGQGKQWDPLVVSALLAHL